MSAEKIIEGRAAADRPLAAEIGCAVLRVLLGLLFVYAGAAKFVEPLPFMATLEAATWLPTAVSRLVLVGLPAVELALGLTLLLGWKRRLVAAGSFLLVAAFTGFLLIETARGNSGCGCFGDVSGPLAALTTGAGALVRNGLLLLTTGALALDRGPADRWSLEHLTTSAADV